MVEAQHPATAATVNKATLPQAAIYNDGTLPQAAVCVDIHANNAAMLTRMLALEQTGGESWIPPYALIPGPSCLPLTLSRILNAGQSRGYVARYSMLRPVCTTDRASL